MTILLDPPQPDSPSFEIDHQLIVALATLHESGIKVRGVGRFGGLVGKLILQSERDEAVALRMLRIAGILATVDVPAPMTFSTATASQHINP